jgi:restriction endonuclease S subunit
MAVWFTEPISALEFGNRIDAELYRPSLRQSFERMFQTGLPVTRLRRVCIILSGTTPPDRIDGLTSGPILFKTTDIRNGIISSQGEYYRITDEVHRRMAKTRLEDRDVLLNIVGATLEVIGRSAFVYQLDDEANITQAMVFLRCQTPDVLPGFLFAYLNTKYGQDQIARYARPTGQYNLNIQEVGHICIPLLPVYEQRAIEKLILSAGDLLKVSAESYAKAEQRLKTELGLDKLTFEKPVGYTARLSEATARGRIDADYFQIPFRQIDKHLDKYTTAQLHTLVDIAKGIEVGSAAYQASGYPFLRVSNVKETGIEIGPSDKYISPALYSRLQDYRPQVGEILLTKDGSPGVAMSVDQDCDGIISGGIVRLKPKNSNVPNEYLALAINSRLCRMQVERECSGALILHWKPASIRKLRIPILAEPIMRQIADLVIKAKLARRESVRLLEQAKARVEQLIEEAVRP